MTVTRICLHQPHFRTSSRLFLQILICPPPHFLSPPESPRTPARLWVAVMGNVTFAFAAVHEQRASKSISDAQSRGQPSSAPSRVAFGLIHDVFLSLFNSPQFHHQ